jgi:G3E family GTPase
VPRASLPIVLLSGFLGSGKSTLLARLLRQRGFANTAVVVNEFGAVGVDHALIAQGREDNVVLLESGCICCTLTSSLEDTLEALYYRRERGELPPFARVVVETTGLASVGPIATALAGGAFVSRQFHLGAIVVAVDALHGAGQIDAHAETREQIAMADRIVLTKLDLDAGGAAARTRAAIAAINPSAPVASASHGEIDPRWLSADVRDAPPEGGASAGIPDPDAARAGHIHEHGAVGHIHEHGYVSATARVAQPLSWGRYAAWIVRLQREGGARLLRVKGFVPFDDGTVRAIHGVQLLYSPPTPIDWTLDPALVGTVVLIAHDLPQPALNALAAAL